MITDFTCKYLSGTKSETFDIADHYLPPAFTVPAKKTHTERFKMTLPQGVDKQLPNDLFTVSFIITFKQGRNWKKHSLVGTDIA